MGKDTDDDAEVLRVCLCQSEDQRGDSRRSDGR